MEGAEVREEIEDIQKELFTLSWTLAESDKDELRACVDILERLTKIVEAHHWWAVEHMDNHQIEEERNNDQADQK